MATQPKRKSKQAAKKPVNKKKVMAKSPAKPPVKAKPQIKAKAGQPAPPQKPVTKVHPFAQFMKGRISTHLSHAPMAKLFSHETYRKKAI